MNKLINVRKPVLGQDKRIWLDNECHRMLRWLKKSEKQSMAQIVKNLIAVKYSQVNLNQNYGRKKR